MMKLAIIGNAYGTAASLMQLVTTGQPKYLMAAVLFTIAILFLPYPER